MTVDPTTIPDVSVVVPAYNPGAFLRVTLDSILAQEGVTFEVIVADDGSTDDTPELVAEYADRVRYVRIPNSGGPSTPRNVGVREARAEFVALFDADDVMLPGKLAASVSALRATPSAGMLCTEFQGVDGEGRVIKERWLADYTEFRAQLEPGPGPDAGLFKAAPAYRHLLRVNFVGTSSVVGRAKAFADVGPFNEDMKNGDDRDMWLRMARGGWDILFLDRVYHSYRKSGGGVTARGGLRNLHIIGCMTRQLPHLEHEEDRRYVLGRIQELWRGYAYDLRVAGDGPGARDAYRKAMSYGFDLGSAMGWLRAIFGF